MEFLNKHIDMQIQLVQGIAAEIFCERSIYIYIYIHSVVYVSFGFFQKWVQADSKHQGSVFL